jgi:hypothetical protein
LFNRACAEARERGAAWLSAALKRAGATCLSEMTDDQLRSLVS